MIYAIMSDYHGADLEALGVGRFLEEAGADAVISLGDFDRARTIHQYLAITAKVRVVEVPGNHDYALLLGQAIFSETIAAEGMTAEQLHRELYADPVALAHVKRLVDHSPPGRRGNAQMFALGGSAGFQAVAVHGALDGSMHSYPGCPPSLRDVWARLETDEDCAANFRAMMDMGVSVMIRGHDHAPGYAWKDGDAVRRQSVRNGSAIRMVPGRACVINPGAMHDGLLATIDTGRGAGPMEPVLTFHRL